LSVPSVLHRSGVIDYRAVTVHPVLRAEPKWRRDESGAGVQSKHYQLSNYSFRIADSRELRFRDASGFQITELHNILTVGTPLVVDVTLRVGTVSRRRGCGIDFSAWKPLTPVSDVWVRTGAGLATERAQPLSLLTLGRRGARTTNGRARYARVWLT